MNPTRRVVLRGPSTFEQLGFVRKILAPLRGEIPLPEDLFARLDICLIEAAGNAIRHAYELRPDGVLEISAELHADRFVLEIADRGRSMPPEVQRRLHEDVPLPVADPQSLDDVPESGMGFPILRVVCDEISYATMDGRNALRLTVRLPAGSIAPA